MLSVPEIQRFFAPEAEGNLKKQQPAFCDLLLSSRSAGWDYFECTLLWITTCIPENPADGAAGQQ